MRRYLLGRTLSVGFVLLGISLLVFSMVALLPGDPATAILGPYATEERATELRQQLGLDGGVIERYLAWLSLVLTGDFGRSYSLGRPVLELLAERSMPTAISSSAALGLGTLIGLMLGSVAAVHRGRWIDRALTFISLLGISTPPFWMAMLLMLVLSVHVGWFPVSGMYSVYGAQAGTWLDLVHHLVLPSLVLAMVVAGVIARMMRTAMLETLSSSFVRMARAKGVTEGSVVYGHAFQVALCRIVPVIGLQAGFVLGGAVYIEAVFQWPGLGQLLLGAILERDLLLSQGVVLVIACGYVVVNLATDLLQLALDPRLRP